MLIEVLLLSFVFPNRRSGISVALATSATRTSSSGISSVTSTLGPTSIPTATASFPPIGSIPRDYTPEGQEKLWDIIGPVEPPPFTTTRIPGAAVTLPPSPPPLYPTFYAPLPKDVLPGLKFPKGFIFGVDTAAYQVEGATKNEGKGPTIMHYRYNADLATEIVVGDVVDLHFLYKEDVQLRPPWCHCAFFLACIGIQVTRLLRTMSRSISWARIYPFGAADSPINIAGTIHYSDGLWRGACCNFVEIVHWETPLALKAYYGAFTSPEIVDDFVNYAKTVFKAYNGRILLTSHVLIVARLQPILSVHILIYQTPSASLPLRIDATLVPGVNSSAAPYRCTYNLLKAHAGVVKDLGTPWRNNSTEDALAVECHAAFQIGIFSNFVYTTGDWPNIVGDTLPSEYLLRFTDQEKRDILGSADFFAIDSYRSQWVRASVEGIDACVANTSHPLWPVCNEPVLFDSDYGWAIGPAADPLATWLQATPVAVGTLLKDLHSRWPSNKLYVSEFGFAGPYENEKTDLSQIKEDVDRTNYFLTYLGEMLLCIHEDGVPIQGAFAWAMLDNAEWASGTSVRFGIQHVNYTTLERTYKCSALSLAEFFASHL
ncbi:glycoside hydrolase superfamily [Desarmillaria tabescens]|uniref:Glycoside hydrolase superfamily n=1 Tax=Armillaria tabescens TaxID=1929756 RepID=A0AA39MZ48_ARMTA|nr:glycoside hydrolase superfamily [Desarmillaria tabescens]KAK0451444.1 glycoside hydrolase superfamily [Desarmillaria tabescens]